MKTITKPETITYFQIASQLNRAGIQYSLLRDTNLGDGNLDELDLLIWPDHKNRFTKLIQGIGFVLLKSGIPGKAVYGCLSGEKFLLLDVHFALIQNGLKYLPLNGLADRLETTADGFKKLSAEDELLHLFYHNLIGKHHLQQKHLSIVKELIAATPDIAYLKNCIPNTRLQEIFYDFLRTPESFFSDKNYASQKSREVRGILTRQSFKNARGAFSFNFLRKWHFSRRGIHFAFLGVDGAGKSTLVETVQQQLSGLGKIKYRFVYMGPWGYIRSPFLKPVYRLKLFPPKEDWATILHNKLTGKGKKYSLLTIIQKLITGTLKGWVYYFAVYLEQWYRYLREIRPRLKKGQIILSDRYTYDLRYIYKKRPIKPFKFWRWFVCRFFPQPDRVIFVFNDAEDIIARKPQLNAGEINLFQTYYRKVLARYNTLEIKSDQPPEVLAQLVVREIVKLYLGRSA